MSTGKGVDFIRCWLQRRDCGRKASGFGWPCAVSSPPISSLSGHCDMGQNAIRVSGSVLTCFVGVMAVPLDSNLKKLNSRELVEMINPETNTELTIRTGLAEIVQRLRAGDHRLVRNKLHETAAAPREAFLKESAFLPLITAALARSAGRHTESAALAAEAMAVISNEKAEVARQFVRRSVLPHLVSLTSAGRHFKGDTSAVKCSEAAAHALWAFSGHVANIGTTTAHCVWIAVSERSSHFMSDAVIQARAIQSLSDLVIHWTSSKASRLILTI